MLVVANDIIGSATVSVVDETTVSVPDTVRLPETVKSDTVKFAELSNSSAPTASAAIFALVTWSAPRCIVSILPVTSSALST